LNYNCNIQQTIACEVSISGVGLHSGKNVNMKLIPGCEDTGIVFRRVDIPCKPEMQATYQKISNTFMSTCLEGSFKIMTVEHFLAAVSALSIDNLIVEIDSDELPILDGSSQEFIFMLQSAGLVKQNVARKYCRVLKSLKVTHKDGYVKIKPYNGLRISFTLDYDHPAFPSSVKKYSIDFNESCFEHNVGPARTYGFMDDFEILRSQGLIKGGSFDNAMVFDKEGLVNYSGFRFGDECARHKTLDVVGDVRLIGMPLLADIECYKSGHTLNHMLVKAIMSEASAYEVVESI